jgi:prolyl 4-hydroxylase
VRLLTFYIYLNDVEEGGGTHFTDLGISVQPKRGRVVLWPSVLDSNLEAIEPMTHHEALAPVSGTKFGANLWYAAVRIRDSSTLL